MVCLFSIYSFASEPNSEVKLVNQVLFEVGKTAYTTYDFKNYLKTKKDLKIESLLTLVRNDLQEFILFQISLLEVKNLDLELSETESKQGANKDQYDFLKVQKFLKLKEKHIGQIERYKSWIDVLKRKYNYLPRTDELRFD